MGKRNETKRNTESPVTTLRRHLEPKIWNMFHCASKMALRRDSVRLIGCLFVNAQATTSSSKILQVCYKKSKIYAEQT